MSQSLSKIYIHIVFSAKYRHPWITETIEPELYAYMASILKTCESPALIINGMPEHIHILSRLSKNYAVSKVVEQVKKKSSKWIKTKGKAFAQFYWQNGYGAFSVSQSQVERVRKYIENQKAHHSKQNFQDEYRSLLRKYEIDFDEQYVWD